MADYVSVPRTVRLRRLAAFAVVAGISIAGAPCFAQSASDREMRQVFELILQDPGNPTHNLRYARMALDRGNLRQALVAYERILARDPNNEDAKEGLRRVRLRLEPSITRVTVLSGAQYESNARRLPHTNGTTYDATMFTRVNVRDDRTIGATRWVTRGEVYANYHPRFHDIDYGSVQAQSGPVFDLGDNFRIHPFAGAGYSWLTRRTFFAEATAGATFEFDAFQPLRDIEVRWGYDFVGSAFSTRDGTYVEVSPRFQFPNLLTKGAVGIAVPYWRYSGVFGSGSPGVDSLNTPFPARSHQFGARLDYFLPLLSWLTVDFNFSYDYRHYFERVSDGSKQRRDHTFVPGVQIVIPGLLRGQVDLIGHYAYEYRSTNDGPERYQNHVAGLRMLWRL